MKTIRFKVKHLLLIVIAAGVVIGFGDTIFWSGVGFYNRVMPESYAINISTLKADTVEGENHRLNLLLSEQHYNLYDLVTVSEGATTPSSHIQRISGQKVYDQYLSFGEEEDLLSEYPEYVLNVALVQWFSGDIEKTDEIMTAIDPEVLDDADRDHYYLIRAGVALTFNEIESAIEALSFVEDKQYDETKNAIRTFISLYLNPSVEYDKIENIENIILDEEDDPYIRYFSQVYGILQRAQYSKSHDPQTVEGTLSVSGSVKRNGEPLGGVFIYEDIDSGMSSNEGFQTRVFMTDDKGEFQIPQVDLRAETLGIIMPWQLICDQQFEHDWALTHEEGVDTVSFEFNDGVRFTDIEITGDRMEYAISDALFTEDREYYIKVRFTDPEYDINGVVAEMDVVVDDFKGSIDFNELKRKMFSPYTYSSGEVTFERLMEPLYLSGEYYFELMPIADDPADHIYNGLFSDALSYAMEVNGENLSTGDSLIKERKIKEAIEWYQEDLSMHSLKVLIALYTRGYIEDEDARFQPWELEGADKHQAIDYTEMLIDRYGITRTDLAKLSKLYRDLEQYENEHAVLLKMDQEFSDIYVTYDLARNLINLGRYEEGIKLYAEKGNAENDADRYFQYVLIGNHQEYLTPKYAEAMEKVDLKEYESYFEKVRSGQYEMAWNWLLEQEDSDLKTFYKLLMLESFDTETINYDQIIEQEMFEGASGRIDRIEYYVSQTNQMHNVDLKQVLIMLRKDNNWF